jgi:hypothetical protein
MAEATTPQNDPRLVRAGALLDKLWNDPKVGAAIRASAKEMYPETAVPEDNPVFVALRDENAALKARFDKMEEDRAAERKAAAEKQADADIGAKLEAARTKFSLTQEGFEKMVQRMKDTQNYTDAEAAAAWVASQSPPVSPTKGPSWAPQSLNLYGSKTPDDNFALLHKDPEAYFDATVAEILAEGQAA